MWKRNLKCQLHLNSESMNNKDNVQVFKRQLSLNSIKRQSHDNLDNSSLEISCVTNFNKTIFLKHSDGKAP
jgi:hypothetical protein